MLDVGVEIVCVVEEWIGGKDDQDVMSVLEETTFAQDL